ncbi:MAG: hypothetical protein J6W76_02980 [Spirochaetales bacterium]|nr:hypothetical protein [Spirochaetales bacterium]
MVTHEASYYIQVGKDNPYVVPIACIIAGVALALPLIFVLCLKYELICMSPKGVIITISMYAGLLTIGIVTSMTVPMFVQAARSVTITGEVISFSSRRIIGKNQRSVPTPVVEYEYNGKTFQKSMSSARSYGTEIGTEVPLLVSRKSPAKVITPRQRTLTIILVVISLIGGVISIFPLLLLIWALPRLIRAAHSDKVTGRIIEITPCRMEYSSIVKYEYAGQIYESQLSSWSSVRPTIGADATLRVNPKKPNTVISIGQIIFAAFATLVFTAAGVLFGSLGFLIPIDNSAMTFKGDIKDMLIGLLIWGGFILFWLLLGIILLIRVKKKSSKQSLRETGIRQVCTIDDVKVNTAVVVNGMNPVRLICSSGGRTYTVKTKIPDGSSCPYGVGDDIDIYVDPNNEKKFLADLK